MIKLYFNKLKEKIINSNKPIKNLNETYFPHSLYWGCYTKKFTQNGKIYSYLHKECFLIENHKQGNSPFKITGENELMSLSNILVDADNYILVEHNDIVYTIFKKSFKDLYVGPGFTMNEIKQFTNIENRINKEQAIKKYLIDDNEIIATI